MAAFSDWVGTMLSYFQIGGTGGVRLKNNSGLDVRNAADAAYVNISGATLKANDPDVILDADGNALTVSRNSAQSGNLQVIFPGAKGTDGQVIAQKASTGAGIIEFEFVTAASTASCATMDTTSLAFGSSSPVSMFTLPANAVIHEIIVIVDTAFNGTAPTMTVGVAGTTSKYVGATLVDLKTAGSYTIHPTSTADASTEALIITYSADSSSAGAARIIVAYSVPQ